MEQLKPLEHKFKAFFFNLFRFTLRKGRKDFKPIDGDKLHKVLFLRPEKLGDMIISFPVFDGLLKRYPHIKISVMGSPRNYAIIKDDPRFEKIFLYTKNVWHDLKELKAIRREKYDCVVDMICDDSVTALFLSQLCAPGKPRIGVGKVCYREYYDFNYDHRMGNTGHIIENTLKLLEAFGIDTDQVDPYAQPYVDRHSLDRADEFIRGLRNGNAGTLVVGYNLSAGARTRIWAKEKARELVEKILAYRDDCRVVLITTPADRSRGDELQSHFGERVFQVPPNLSLISVSALISRLDLLISPDTSLVHIARSFKVPVVGLYSRFMKNFLLWRPFDQELGAVVSGNDDNIFDITVDQVYDTFVKVVEHPELVTK